MITMLKAKLHRATVTSSLIDYEGSCAIDKEWLEDIGVREFEQIHIYNVNTGARFVTYAIDGAPGEISVRGAAGHLAKTGDVVIIAAYEIGHFPYGYKPRVIHFGPDNSRID